jgi:hypothetical protein
MSNTTGTAYAPKPNLVYGMEHGSNPRQNAMNYQLSQDAEQNQLNKTHGGRRGRKSLKKRTRRSRNKRGGSQKLVVPSFPTVGPAVSPISNTSNSVATNQTRLDAQVNACNDCYATNTCASTPGCPQQGGTRRKAYAISTRRVSKSPFKSVSSVKKTLRRYKKGQKIGYTQRSSLRSMGLIPRANGGFLLGHKYK